MLSSTNPYQQYRKQGVMTASPVELIVMLYDGAIKFIQLGRMALEEGRQEDAAVSLVRAQDIIGELTGSLDMDIEISHELFDLYDFCHGILYDALVAKDFSKLGDVAEIFSSLREAWVTISKQNRMHYALAVDE